MNEVYHELQSHLASYLTHIAKVGEARTLQIMFLLKTAEQVLTIMEYIEKHKNNQLTEEHLLDVALVISEQVK